MRTVDPHEARQKAILHRIVGSVTRLDKVMQEVNEQMEKINQHGEEIGKVSNTWSAYAKNVQLYCPTESAGKGKTTML